MSIRAQRGCRGLMAKTPVDSFRNKYEQTAHVARQVAASRTAAERWDARGKPEKASESRAEEAEILQNARNFKITLPTEEQILAACDCARRAWVTEQARRAAEEAELA